MDVLQAEQAAREAESLFESGRLEAASAAATDAESVLRRPFLPGDEGIWIEGRRRELADSRARALAVLAETALRSGKAQESARWADQLIEIEPFRESGYRHLMAAHIAAGNRAQALQVYERCRRLLAEELGAYPSPETEAIYRGLLDMPIRVETEAETASTPGLEAHRARGRSGRARVMAAVAVLAIAGVATAVVATGRDGPRASASPREVRVALLVPRTPPGSDDPSAQYEAALYRARHTYGVQTQTFEIDLSKPGLTEGVRESIGSFDLVLLAGQFVDARFVDEIGRHPRTHFVVMDPDPEAPLLYSAVGKLRNATDVFFVEGPGAYLAGYLSALMAKRRYGTRPVVVSLIAVDPLVNENQVAGFSAGATEAVPGTAVLEDYSHDFVHPSACAAIANRQIDHGSTAVFADAGACSIGALSTAGVRGVWGVGTDEDMSYVGPQILVSTVKRLDRAVDYVVRSYLGGTLPQGHLDIGIERGAVAIVGINRAVPAPFRAELVRVQQDHMPLWTSWATPLK